MKYIGYARIASQHQADASSLNRQTEMLHEYARNNNLILEEVISESASGTSIDRTGIKTLLERLSTGQYKGILCTRIDRISRNSTDFLVFKQFMDKKGLVIITTEEKLENNPASRLVNSMMAAIAEYERAEISERIKVGIAKANLKRKSAQN